MSKYLSPKKFPKGSLHEIKTNYVFPWSHPCLGVNQHLGLANKDWWTPL